LKDAMNMLIGSLSRMIQFADVVPDVYEMAVYAVCFHNQANGAFLSVSGTTEYFDYVVGSYKLKRHSIKGGNHVWEYEVPDKGRVIRSAGVWLYKSTIAGWLFGVDSDEKPDPGFIESVNIAALAAMGFVREKENRVEGRDRLTGLCDRGTFYRDLKHIAEISEKMGTKLWLIFVDLNNFKPVNDILGHLMGDRILVSQAANLQHALSDFGTVYRYGGDEFAAIISGQDERVIRDVVKRIETTSEQSPGGIKVSASAGATLYEGGEDVESFVKRADDEMYAAKKLYKRLHTDIQVR
jgi:diguanylate cyclase (GGDEF)-like protein